MVTWLCLALALAFAALGLLAIFRAPTFPLFFVAVGATEFGHFFALAAGALAIVTPKDSMAGWIASGVAALAALALISPLSRALSGAGGIRREFNRGLGADMRRPLIRLGAVWRPAISYGPKGERLAVDGLGIDFYRAIGATPAPLVVVIHGGGWMAGDSSELAGWNGWLAARGYAVAAIDYRLVPTGAWPAQREDVLAAVEHLRTRSAEFGIDRDRVIFLGRSAGGQIASAIAAAGEHRWLRGCVCFYAPFDMVFAYEHGSDSDILRSRWLLRCFLGGAPETRADAYREASAYLSVGENAPPFLLLHGDRDELVWVLQSERFARRLTELGVPNAFLRLPWATHAFDYNMSGPGGQVAAACLEAFLGRVSSLDRA